MKHPRFIAISFAATFLFIFFSPYSLVGKWTIPGANEYVNFKKDGTYEVLLPNGKVGESGFYSLTDSVFKIKNAKPVCGDGYWGTYKLRFVSEDSVLFSLVEDSCNARRMDIVGYNPGLRRVK